MIKCSLFHFFLILPPLISANSDNLLPHGQVTVSVPIPKKPLQPGLTLLSITSKSSTSNINDSSSILFAALHKGFLNTWSLEGSERNQGSSKELCELPMPGKQAEEEVEEKSGRHVSVNAFSTSLTEQAVEFKAAWEDAELPLGRNVSISLKAGSSKVLYHMPSVDYNTGESYLLSLSSPSEDCFLVAISPPTCPWPDTVAGAAQAPTFGKILSKGFFPIRASDFNSSFVVSLISLKESTSCRSTGWMGSSEGQRHKNKNPEKKVTVLLKRVREDYWEPIAKSVGPILASAVFIIISWIVYFKIQLCNNETRLNSTGNTDHDSEMKASGGETIVGENGHTSNNEEPGEEGNADPLAELCTVEAYDGDNRKKEVAKKLTRNRSSSKKDSNRLSSKKARNRLVEHRILRGQDMCLNDFTLDISSKDSWQRRQRSKAYLYLVPLLSIFYLVPSVQMVFMLEDVARETNQKCYRNFGCSRPWGIFEDFNHIISNVGYIAYGAAFILMVFLKSRMLPKRNIKQKGCDSNFGLVQQFGIFYTMGFSMLMQGIFSCIFHICPSNISLQFDTTMMYVMLILVYVKVYQFRHPDISAKSFLAMYTLAGALVLEACSLYIHPIGGKAIFYAVFCLFYLSILLKTAFDMYYHGSTSFWTRAAMLKQSAKNGTYCLSPIRFVLMILVVLLNIGLMCFLVTHNALKSGPQGFSSPILVICGFNVTVFLFHYIYYKVREVKRIREKGTYAKFIRLAFSSLLLLSALGLAGWAMKFYLARHQSRNLTAAESRNLNDPCSVLDFFDNHDIWHFLSSAALFLVFIFLLTIDDDTLALKRQEIRVF